MVEILTANPDIMNNLKGKMFAKMPFSAAALCATGRFSLLYVCSYSTIYCNDSAHHLARTLLIIVPTHRRHASTPACTGAKIADRMMMKVPTTTNVIGNDTVGLYGRCSSGSRCRKTSNPITVLT